MQYGVFIMRSSELEVPADRVVEPEELTAAIYKTIKQSLSSGHNAQGGAHVRVGKRSSRLSASLRNG